MTERSEFERAMRADPRFTEVPVPCMHCKHLLTVGSQFASEGWTCAAYPKQIPYTVLTRRTPHTEPLENQPGDLVAFDPKIYTEAVTGRKWHYTADGGWVYVDTCTDEIISPE